MASQLIEQQPRQLALAVALNDEATFANFLSHSDRVDEVVFFLKDFISKAQKQQLFCYLAGSKGSGRSHLLQACCHQANLQGQNCQYLPLTELAAFNPVELLENMEKNAVICIDDIQVIAKVADWERGLFHLYNRVRDMGHKLVVSGSAVPGALNVELADLVSRLGWGPVFQLNTLNDEQKMAIIQFRAKTRGMTMSTEVAQYLLTRASRDISSLIQLLKSLDNISLEQQRMLTIPFIKQLLSQ